MSTKVKHILGWVFVSWPLVVMVMWLALTINWIVVLIALALFVLAYLFYVGLDWITTP